MKAGVSSNSIYNTKLTAEKQPSSVQPYLYFTIHVYYHHLASRKSNPTKEIWRDATKLSLFNVSLN